VCSVFVFFQAEDGIRDRNVTGVQTCALPILSRPLPSEPSSVTLVRSASGAWHVSFVVEVPDPTPLPETGRVAGIDLGLTDLAAKIGRASCRERVESAGGRGALRRTHEATEEQ